MCEYLFFDIASSSPDDKRALETTVSSLAAATQLTAWFEGARWGESDAQRLRALVDGIGPPSSDGSVLFEVTDGTCCYGGPPNSATDYASVDYARHPHIVFVRGLLAAASGRAMRILVAPYNWYSANDWRPPVVNEAAGAFLEHFTTFDPENTLCLGAPRAFRVVAGPVP